MQCVNTLTGFPAFFRAICRKRFNPCCPIIRQCSASSSAISLAVRKASATFSSTVFPSAIFFSWRSTAQERLTAVGLAAFSCAAALARCSSNSGIAGRAAAASIAARYIPYPALAPIRPAPRTCISRIAAAICSTVRTSSITKRCGKNRWSISCTTH